jgi:hypothetical protein
MTRREALIDLRDKVKADKFNDAINAAESMWGTYASPSVYFTRSLRGSLDAAKALHDEVLPGWWWSLDNRMASVSDMSVGPWFNAAIDNNPARSWLLAILEALLNKETHK